MSSDPVGIDLSKPLPPGETRTLYVVHRGFARANENDKTASLANPVCTRTTSEDAHSVAHRLNETQEGVFYLSWVASSKFPMATGNADALMQQADNDSVSDEWERMVAEKRQPIYMVSEVKIKEGDAKEFEGVLCEEGKKNSTGTE